MNTPGTPGALGGQGERDNLNGVSELKSGTGAFVMTTTGRLAPPYTRDEGYIYIFDSP